MDRVGVGARVDDDAALGLVPGDLEEAGPQSLMKRDIHALVTVIAATLARPGETEGDGRIENDREVGDKFADDERVKPRDRLAIKAMGVTLVGERSNRRIDPRPPIRRVRAPATPS